MVDAMSRLNARLAARRRTRATGDLRRASALLLAGVFVAAGCGSAAGETASSTPGSAPAHSAGHRSGIAGQAVILVCGGASAGSQGCRRHPVTATIAVRRMPSQRHITTVRTDAAGRFQVDLPPGVYQLQAHASSSAALARVVTVRVRPHQVARAAVTLVPRHPLPLAPAAPSG
jgi:hypothetical protein